MDDTSTPPTPIRSKEIWFEDGDIVLSVIEDGIEHHFRVHRSILSMASPVFRDMLSMPQPSSDENLPISLRDDSVHDLTALLRELYIVREAQIMTFEVALGILRLSHKYQIDGLQQRMKLILQKDWLIRHSDYQARLTFLGSPEYRISQAVKVIETAHRCGANELLPTAFYELSCVRGTPCLEIARDLSPENVARLWVGHSRVEHRLKSLVDSNRTASTQLWGNSYKEQTIFDYRKKFSACPKYNHQNNYGIVCLSLFPTFRSILAQRLFDGTPGFTVLQKFNCESLGQDVCSSCKQWFKGILENKTQELWENIPTDFDLPPIASELYSKGQISGL